MGAGFDGWARIKIHVHSFKPVPIRVQRCGGFAIIVLFRRVKFDAIILLWVAFDAIVFLRSD